MCGRIAQFRKWEDYVETIGFKPHALFSDPVGPRYNVPPGTRPMTMHCIVEPKGTIQRLPWGYKRNDSPHFMTNAKIETIMRNGWPWRFMLGKHRIIVPADGWYEWMPTDNGKQPYFIHRKDGQAILMPGLSAWKPGEELDAAHGFAIVTDATGLVDMKNIHDRRPAVLPAQLARDWLDESVDAARAKEILAGRLAEDAFVWHPVKKEVGNSRYELPDAVAPIDD
jgi:putative SOS response-associated peptidase YedK